MLRLEATKPLQNVLDREKTKVKKKAEKAAEIITAPYVLKRGVAVSGHRNHKGKGYPSVTFGGKVSINGVEGVEGVCVLYGDKDRVHSLRILAPNGEEFELIKNNTEVAKGGSTEGVDTPTKSVPNNILLPNTQKSQEENLIKNQENGTPALLNYIVKNGSAKQDTRLSGLIALSSDTYNFTDTSKSIEQG